MKEFENIVSSKKVRLTAGVIGALVLTLLIFHVGVVFGSHRNSFGGPSGRPDMVPGFRPPFFPGDFALPHGFIPNAHGAVGAITAITLPTLTMETREGTSKTILVSTSTIIQNGENPKNVTLSVGGQIIVLGDTDSEGRIGAKIIRMLPALMPRP